MASKPESAGVFKKVGECLYRYSTNGRYYGRFVVHGKEYRISLKTNDKKEAERKLGEKIREKSRVTSSIGRIPFTALIDKYLGTIGHFAPKIIKQRKRMCKRIQEEWPVPSSICSSKIETSQVRTFLSAFDVGPPAYNAYLETLRGIFAIAVEDGFIADSPTAPIKGRKRATPIRKTVSDQEFHAIVSNIRSQVYNADAKDSADFVEFLGESGLGNAEAGALTWGDVDFKSNQLTTFRHKTKKGFQIPIFPNLRKLLLRLKANGSHQPSDKLLKISDAKKAIAGACTRLGLPSYSSRSFRRYFITKAIYKGVNVKTISQWQGHSDGGKLILDTYSHVMDGESQKLAKLMGDTEQKPPMKKRAKNG